MGTADHCACVVCGKSGDPPLYAHGALVCIEHLSITISELALLRVATALEGIQRELVTQGRTRR